VNTIIRPRTHRRISRSRPVVIIGALLAGLVIVAWWGAGGAIAVSVALALYVVVDVIATATGMHRNPRGDA
jgi:Na+/melibiose symporter-like transporter